MPVSGEKEDATGLLARDAQAYGAGGGAFPAPCINLYFLSALRARLRLPERHSTVPPILALCSQKFCAAF